MPGRGGTLNLYVLQPGLAARHVDDEFSHQLLSGTSMLRHALAFTFLCGAGLPLGAFTTNASAAVLLAQNTPAAGENKAPAAEAKPAADGEAAKPEGGAVPQPAAPVQSIYDQDTTNAPERQAECMWTGQRIVSLLSRDDINTAREHMNFYERFGCPKEHVTVAFRCSIRQAERQPEQTDISARVYGCWMSPELGENKPDKAEEPAPAPAPAASKPETGKANGKK
jgi:hypothetical protein